MNFPGAALLDTGLQDVVFHGLEVFVLATARPFGLTLFFAIFAWAHLNSGVLRMSFAIALALPVFGPLAGLPAARAPVLPYPYMLVVLKELGIGCLMGWGASLPFALAASSGHIIDGYRGGTTGDPDPSGGQVTPYAKLFTVIILYLFAQTGGFWVIADAIYASYVIWPLYGASPFAAMLRPGALLEALDQMMLSALVIAAPLVTVMLASDLAFLLSTKFGKQINLSQLAFSVKNTVGLLLLPFFGLMLVRLFRDELGALRVLVQLVERWFR